MVVAQQYQAEQAHNESCGGPLSSLLLRHRHGSAKRGCSTGSTEGRNDDEQGVGALGSSAFEPGEGWRDRKLGWVNKPENKS